MPPDESQQITQLLAAIQQGDRASRDQFMPIVYDELRRLAASHMRKERGNHTLQATALVNEAYLRLAGADLNAKDRVHFFALTAQTMRHILVDYARARSREKRGGGLHQTTLDGSVVVTQDNEASVVELDNALNRLAEFDQRAASAIELMFFGGLTYDEVGSMLGVSKTTIFEDIKLAKALLAKEMSTPQYTQND